MKKTLIIVFLYPIFLFSQSGFDCGTPENTEGMTPKSGSCVQKSSNSQDYFRRYAYQKDLYPTRNVLLIPVDVYVWQKDDGTANYADNSINRGRIDSIFMFLNRFYRENVTPTFQPLSTVVDYDSTKIQFVLKHIYFEKNTTCWGKGGNTDEGITGDGYFLNNVAKNLHPQDSSIFKVHITGYSSAYYSGFATFPTDDFSHQHYIVTLNKPNETVINPVGMWGFAGHLAHEFGHNFDLFHTYNYEYVDGYDKCNEANVDYLDDVFGSSSNNSKICPQSAGWSCDPYDTSNTCTNNMMGGTQSSRYFSPKQIQRMHRALSLLSIRNYAIVQNFDENKFIEIDSTQTWDFSTKLYNNLKVKAGTTLTIQCEVQFVPEAKVIIEPGGKLIIDGGKLTNEKYYNNFWQGIQVYGTSNKNQFPESNPTYQGLLVIKNGGIIENAHKAVTNWHQDNWNEIGGVIQATGAVFRNNRRDVEFMSYQNYNTNYTNKYRNLSKFTNTDFITTNDFIEKGLAIQTHVTMWQVDGITFTNCHFSNDITTNKNNSSAPNRGIYSIDAGYSVLAGCSTTPPLGQQCPTANLLKSSFKGFSSAIEATGAATTQTVTIQQANFIDNVWGITIDEFDNVSLNRNTMDVGDADYTLFWPIGAGIMVNNSTGYKIEENTVSTNLAGGFRVGINVSNSGTDDNRVYKNNLQALNNGVAGNGVNHNSNYQKGLQFLCNNFQNNTTAIAINSSPTNDGVRFYQGNFSPLKSAGNTFTNNTTGINNTANSIVYIHNGGNTQPVNNSGMVSLQSTTNTNSCPTSFGGGIIMKPILLVLDSLNTELGGQTASYNNLNFTYTSLIDNGNTEQFKDNIELNWSDDAWKLRGKLLASSPYLSSEVLLKAAKQNVLPNGMLLEILLANPDATKGEKFISQLKTVTNNTFPEYMLDYVRGNFDSRTLRTDMEGQLSSIHSELSNTRSWIKHLTKSKEEYTDNDRLNVVNLGDDIYSKVGVMDYYITQGAFNKADSVLNTINNDKKYTTDLPLIENFSDYINFRENLGNRNLAQLDSTEVAYLQILANGKSRVAGYAQNILCFFYDICYEKELATGNAQNKAMMIPSANSQEALNNVLYTVTLYPNPAKEYTSIQWEIYDELNNLHYNIVDLNGREQLSGILFDNKGEQVIDTRKLKQGIYIIGIYNNNQLKVSKKLVVENQK